MGGMSIWHWAIVALVVVLLFGGGKLSGLMGDAAKGIKAFKQGLKDDDDDVKTKKPDEEPKA
ncbi:MAG: twin-arginine translocase TatA/TatE family subunit [Asticcacaulis sp.]|uniref:twin-arginine translocase TatA/TatE family subunit n=1 Tax=Asticcacaulis sp. TaxID=1872648 RepID=UPI0039E6F7A3